MEVAAGEIVYLIGFSGCGKSTLGPRLAQKLKARFHDTDAMIEKRTGRSIPEVFRRDGEPAFRRLEEETIAMLSGRSRRSVVALGGGALGRRANREAIKQSGVLVYLSCPVRELYRRLRDMENRPLLKVRPVRGETVRQAKLRRIAALLDSRRTQYQQADIRLSTANKSVAECVDRLYRKVKRYHARRTR